MAYSNGLLITYIIPSFVMLRFNLHALNIATSSFIVHMFILGVLMGVHLHDIVGSCIPRCSEIVAEEKVEKICQIHFQVPIQKHVAIMYVQTILLIIIIIATAIIMYIYYISIILLLCVTYSVEKNKQMQHIPWISNGKWNSAVGVP